MEQLKPWTRSPFELIHHAEGHFKEGSGFDLRMALISYDNSIESSIVTYLELNPVQRRGREFPRKDVDNWKRSFHSKVDFLEYYVVNILNQAMQIDKGDIIFYHMLRNDLYHGGNGFVPSEDHVKGIRRASIWVFSVLFDVNIEPVLNEAINPEAIIKNEIQTPTLSADTDLLQHISEINKKLDKLSKLQAKETIEEDKVNYTSFDNLDPLMAAEPEELEKEYGQYLEKSEKIKRDIISGGNTNASEIEIRNLTKKLDEISEYLNRKLQLHQVSISDTALQATKLASESNEKDRKIGIVWQAQGSGVSVTLVSYLAQLFQVPKFQGFKVVVISDRNLEIDRLYQLIKKDLGSTLSIRKIDDTIRLKRLLNSQAREMVSLVTLQKLSSNKNLASCHSSEVIVISYGLQRGFHMLREFFPNGLFIHFTNTPPPYHEDILEVFGDHLAQYDFKNALADDAISPIRVFLKSDESGLEYSRRFYGQYLSKIAKDITLHFASRSLKNHRKGIIIVPNLEIGKALLNEIISLKPEWKENNIVQLFSSRVSYMNKGQIIRQLQDPDAMNLTIFIDQWSGVSIPHLDNLYLLKVLPKFILDRAVALLTAKREDNGFGEIIDYGGHNWDPFEELIVF